MVVDAFFAKPLLWLQSAGQLTPERRAGHRESEGRWASSNAMARPLGDVAQAIEDLSQRVSPLRQFFRQKRESSFESF